MREAVRRLLHQLIKSTGACWTSRSYDRIEGTVAAGEQDCDGSREQHFSMIHRIIWLHVLDRHIRIITHDLLGTPLPNVTEAERGTDPREADDQKRTFPSLTVHLGRRIRK